jgi:hypothetical protein
MLAIIRISIHRFPQSIEIFDRVPTSGGFIAFAGAFLFSLKEFPCGAPRLCRDPPIFDFCQQH